MKNGARKRWLCGVAWGVAAMGCGSSGGAPIGAGGAVQCVPGEERCPCFSNATCAGSLTCASEVCVDLGSGGSGSGTGGYVGSGGATITPGTGGIIVDPGTGGSGGTSVAPAQEGTCTDGVQNGTETAVDCGTTCVRLDAVFLGAPEFVTLVNIGRCAVDIAGIGVLFKENYNYTTYATVLPARTVAPNETVRLVDSAVLSPGAGDLVVDGNISFSAKSGGFVTLCDGSCDSSSPIVFDVVAIESAFAGHTLPGGAEFDGWLASITTLTENSTEYARVAYAGHYPMFLSADWSTAPAVAPNCPASTPPLTTCTAVGTVCQSQGVVCTCKLNFDLSGYEWSCVPV